MWQSYRFKGWRWLLRRIFFLFFHFNIFLPKTEHDWRCSFYGRGFWWAWRIQPWVKKNEHCTTKLCREINVRMTSLHNLLLLRHTDTHRSATTFSWIANDSLFQGWGVDTRCGQSYNRELKQPRRRRQQKPHKFAYLTLKNSIFARFARAFFIFRHFEHVLGHSMIWKDLFCSCVDDVSIWWQMFNFIPSAGSNLISG